MSHGPFLGTRAAACAGIRTRRAAGHVLVDSTVGTIVDIGPGFGILRDSPNRHGGRRDRRARTRARPVDRLSPTLSVLHAHRRERTGHASGANADQRLGRPGRHARRSAANSAGDFGAAITGPERCASATWCSPSVYAVEASDIAEVAERARPTRCRTGDDRSGCDSRSNPGRADLLVAEVIGNEPLEEETSRPHYRSPLRLWRRRARLIRTTSRCWGTPRARSRSPGPAAEMFGRAAVALGGMYGDRLRPLLDAHVSGSSPPSPKAKSSRTWPQVGAPVESTSLVCNVIAQSSVRGRPTSARATRPGERDRVHVHAAACRGHSTMEPGDGPRRVGDLGLVLPNTLEVGDGSVPSGAVMAAGRPAHPPA